MYDDPSCMAETEQDSSSYPECPDNQLGLLSTPDSLS